MMDRAKYPDNVLWDRKIFHNEQTRQNAFTYAVWAGNGAQSRTAPTMKVVCFDRFAFDWHVDEVPEAGQISEYEMTPLGLPGTAIKQDTDADKDQKDEDSGSQRKSHPQSRPKYLCAPWVLPIFDADDFGSRIDCQSKYSLLFFFRRKT